MKKLLLMLVLLLTMVLAACGTEDGNEEGSTDSSTNAEEQADTNEEDAEATEEEEDSEETESNETLTVGDSAEVDGVKFTLKSVSTTDERNEFADEDPTMVVKIEYEIENNKDEEIPIGMDLEVYDNTGSKMDSYPLENTMGSLQPGKNIQGEEHFGIEEGPIEIYFAPLVSFEDAAIFTAEVE
ncbi:DUF5067 domain-containing protein [Gracilibacillus sp. HCP3S3_G5_1]|uniref:DUF5067 domain-containing protein n=1 Tax=unclassified Gracilibacillus TaxID=2625209 RepID=UPI003F8BA5E5